jgi:hypothetical protein
MVYFKHCFHRYCGFGKKEKKKGLSIKFYLTKLDFQYISNSQVV